MSVLVGLIEGDEAEDEQVLLQSLAQACGVPLERLQILSAKDIGGQYESHDLVLEISDGGVEPPSLQVRPPPRTCFYTTTCVCQH